MSDVSLYANRSSYAGEITSFDNNQDVAHKEQQSEVDKAGLDVVSQVETQATSSDVQTTPASLEPINKASGSENADGANKAAENKVAAEPKNDDISAETKENLSSYLSKSCDMYVSHNSQARDNAADMNELLKGAATNPLGKIPLSSGLQEKVNNAVAQKNVGTLPGGEKVLNAQHNLEAFAQIAQNSDSTVRATCGANSISYVANLMSTMSNKAECSAVCAKFMAAAFPYLACENAQEAKKLQDNLEQAMADLKKAAQSGTAQDQGLAQVISNFTNELISQKNESFEILNNSSINGGKVDIIDSNGVFATEQDANGNLTVVSPALKSLSGIGSIANTNADHVANALSSTAYIANLALDSIKNNNLNQAKMEISCVGINNKEAQALVQGVYDQQVEKNANSFVDFILTPKSELKALSNINNGGSNLTENNASASHDLSKFNSNSFADFWGMYKDLNYLAKSPQKLLKQIAKNTSLDATQGEKGAITNSSLLNPDVFNKTVSKLKDIVSSHEGFAAAQKEQIANIENDIAKKLTQIEGLKLDEEAAAQQLQYETNGGIVTPEMIEQLALDNMANKKAMLINDINKDYQMIASCLRDGLTKYVNQHIPAEKFAKTLLAEYGINAKQPFGINNNGVAGLLDSTRFDNIASHPLSANNINAPKYILSGIIDVIAGSSKEGNSNDDVIKTIVGSKGQESINNFDKSQSNEDKQIAFNQGKRIVGAYAVLRNDLGYLAHLLAPANDTATQVSDDNDPAINSAEIEKLFDLISNGDNSDLCQKILATAISSNDSQTIADLGILLQSIERGYEHDNKQSNNIANTKIILSNLFALNSNSFFKELGDDNSALSKLIKSYRDPNNKTLSAEQKIALESLDTAYHNFVKDASYENTLKLSLALHNFKPEFITLDPSNFNATTDNKAQANEQLQVKTNQLKNSLSLLNQYGETLVDLAYAKFQLDNGIKLQNRGQSDENGEFFAAINTLSDGKEDNVKYLQSFMDDGAIRGSTIGYKVLNAAAGTMVNTVDMPNVKTIAKNSDVNIWVNKQRNHVIDFHFAQYPNAAFNDALSEQDGYSSTKSYNTKLQFLAKDIGNYPSFINIGLAYAMSSHYGLDVDSYIAYRQQALDKAGVTETSVSKFLTEKAIKNNEGETQAAAIRMAVALLSDDNFTGADLTKDLVSLYLAQKASDQTISNVSKSALTSTTGSKVSENDIFFALDAARKGNRTQSDCAYLVRALYKEYQNSHEDLTGKAFDDLSQDEYKAMLSSYYSKLNMQVPFELYSVGPSKSEIATQLSYDDKAEAIKCLAKAICNDNHFNLNSELKKELKGHFDKLSEALTNEQKLNKKLEDKKISKDESKKADVLAQINDNQVQLNNAVAAIYLKLTGQADLLEVCDFVMINKSLSNLTKDKTKTTETQQRVFSKVFGSKIADKISSQNAVSIVHRNYHAANEIEQKSTMVKAGEALFMQEIKENPHSNSLFNTAINLALLDVAALYGKDNILALAQEHMGGFLKSAAINGAEHDLTSPNALKANLNITKEQIEALKKKGINIIEVKADAKGNEIVDKSKDASVKPSQADSDAITLKVYKYKNKIPGTEIETGTETVTVKFNELLSATLASKIDIEDHNKMILDKVKDSDIAKDAAGNYLARVPGVVYRQEISQGIVDVLVRDPDLAKKDFFKQAFLGVQVESQNKLNLAKEHINNLVSSIKNGTSFKEKLNEVNEREGKKLEAENVGLLSDVLISMDDSSVICFDNEKKIKLYNLDKKFNLKFIEGNINAEISTSLKNSFIVTKENGNFKFTLSKALATKMGASVKASAEFKKDGLPKDSSISLGAGISAGANIGGDVGSNISFSFDNETDAAFFLNDVIMHDVAQEQLNGADLEAYARGEASFNFDASASMILSIGEKKDEGDQNKTKVDGLIAHASGTATEKKKKESEPTQVGAKASWSFTCEGKGKQSITSGEGYHGFKQHISGIINATGELSAGQLGDNVGNKQLSTARVATIQYDVDTEVHASNVSGTVTSAVRSDNYTITSDNALTSSLSMYGVPDDMVDSLLELHGKTPISSISFVSKMDPMPEVDLSSPVLNEKKNYALDKVVIKFKQDTTLSSFNAMFAEKKDSMTVVKSIKLDSSYLLSKNSDVKTLEKAWKKALEK